MFVMVIICVVMACLPHMIVVGTLSLPLLLALAIMPSVHFLNNDRKNLEELWKQDDYAWKYVRNLVAVTFGGFVLVAASQLSILAAAIALVSGIVLSVAKF